MKNYRVLPNLLLALLLALTASGIVNAKVASGPQHLEAALYQADSLFNLLLHQGKNKSSYDDALGSSVAAKEGADDLLKAGRQADKNGLTKAGRGLQKHGDRDGSVFPKSTGKADARNQQGQDILDGILKSGNQTSKSNRFGGKDIFDNNTGRGVRFDGDGNMIGFLEP